MSSYEALLPDQLRFNLSSIVKCRIDQIWLETFLVLLYQMPYITLTNQTHHIFAESLTLLLQLGLIAVRS